MTSLAKPKLSLWLCGIGAFGVLVILAAVMAQWSAPTIPQHQVAGSAAMVDAIQQQWRADGVRGLAIASMLADLIFIGIYGSGGVIAGLSFARVEDRWLRVLGPAIAAAALVFMLSDYCETLLQLAQLLPDRGVDWMARLAAAMAVPKNLSFVATFLGVVTGWVRWRHICRTRGV